MSLYPKWRRDQCANCADGLPMSAMQPGKHYKRYGDREGCFPPCTAVKTEDEIIAELERQLSESSDRLNEQVIDDKGTVWTVPTAYAYMVTCNALHRTKAEAAEYQRQLSDAKADTERLDRLSKWFRCGEWLAIQNCFMIEKPLREAVDIYAKAIDERAEGVTR